MATHRINRIKEDMKRSLSEIIRELKDPRISPLLSIVKVEVSGDLSYAKVYVSAIEGYEKSVESAKGLKSAAGYIRRELAEVEKLIADYDAKLAAATEYNEADYNAYNELKGRYDHLMHEWEKASYELEITELK